MSIYREVASDMMTPVRFGDGERDFVRAWVAAGMLRGLREQYPERFAALLDDVLAESARPEGKPSAAGAVLPPEPGS